MNYTYNIRGFTLIELSIVLVIIGLIVGGVLTGRELIAAAEVRKTGTLVEELQTATMAFQNKYNCLPGDCKNATDFFGMGDQCGNDRNISTTGTCNGNGDAAIYGISVFSIENSGKENGHFFQQLVQAKLITDTRLCTLNATTCKYEYSLADWGLNIPVASGGAAYGGSAAIGLVNIKQGSWSVGTPAPSSNHAFYFGTLSYDNIAVLTPQVLFSIDSKFDDGYPLSGNIQAVGFNHADIWNGRASNIGDVLVATAACINTGVTPNIYSHDNHFDCPVMWMAGF